MALPGRSAGMYDAPHGAVCAALLPHVMAINVAALRCTRDRTARDCGAMTRSRGWSPAIQVATAEDGAAWVRALTEALHIPGLAAYGLVVADFDELIDKSSRASSMKGNPIPLTPDEMRDILTRAL